MKPVHYAWDDYVRPKKPFWQADAFWVVVLPTALVAFVALVAFIVRVLG